MDVDEESEQTSEAQVLLDTSTWVLKRNFCAYAIGTKVPCAGSFIVPSWVYFGIIWLSFLAERFHFKLVYGMYIRNSSFTQFSIPKTT